MQVLLIKSVEIYSERINQQFILDPFFNLNFYFRIVEIKDIF